ncbi:MAG: hypothetical protein M1838_001883 [Thelocarpon superellum]|nr:MAG: hypothetical protein M1838_001883 [Thelocarpon superellum]
MPRIAIARWHHLPEVRKEFFDQCSRHQQLGRELLDSQARASILLAEYAQLMLGNEDGEQAADGPIDPHASRGNGCPYNEEHRRYLQKSYSANERDLRYLMAEYQRMGRRRDEAGRALSDLKLEMMGEDATALVALTTDAMQAATEGKGGTETDESAEWDLEADRVSRAMLDGGTNRDDGMIVHRATGRAVQTIGTGTSYTDVA